MTKYVFQQSAFSADESVSVAPYASFTFTESATGDPADLWSDDAGLVPITGNVVLADEYGYVRAYLTAGFYDVAIVTGSLTKTLVDVFIGGAAVESVNGQTGIVVLGASDVGADAAGSAAAAQAAAVQRSNHTGTQLASTISDFNATASAAAPVQSVNGNTGAVTVAEGVSRTTLQNTVLWFEDFLTHQSSLWARVTASSGVATTLANDVSMTGMANACGVLRVVWNATGGYCIVSTSTTLDNKRTSVTGKTASSLTAMAIDAYPASATYDFQVFGGWGGFDNNGIASGTTEAALWYFNKDGLYLYTCTGGVSTTSTIALASSGITADAYFRIRIEYTSTAVNLYVDNVLKLTNTTNIPQTYMSTLSWMVRTASAMADYANANLSLDYIDQLFTLTTPRVLT